MVVKVFEELNKVNPFLNKTQVSNYDSLLDDRPLNNDPTAKVSTSEYYRFEKGIEGYIEYMTAEEYIWRCAREIFGTSVDSCLNGTSADKVNKYAELMKNGEKFPLPYLSYEGYRGQEGRHRMLAAAKAFGEDTKFPVLMAVDADPTDEEIRDYVKRRFPNDTKWGYSYVNSILGINQDEEDLELDVSKERKYIEVEAIELSAGDIIDIDSNGNLVKVTDIRLEDDGFVEIYHIPLEGGNELWDLAFEDQRVRYYPEYYSENKDLYESRR